MSENEQLERAITALEAQRSLLGDAVVDAALAPIREKLASLQQPAEEQRKLVTVLFADLVGFTAMSEKMDPEDVQEVVNAYFTRWTRVIGQHGGVVEKFIGDAVVAVFGLTIAQEDDPERAIHAALAMRAELDELNRELEKKNGLMLEMRIGIHTGPVFISLLGERDKRGESQDFVVVGDSVNLASRLQTNAPEGGILISHDTYRHVRGLFEVKTLDLMRVKGKSEPVQVYLVARAKPRAFHVGTRGVEGVETRTIGRDAELRRLTETMAAVLEDGERHMVTLVGEAGIGKSRLIEEFESWAELLPESMVYYRGRAHPSTQNQAASLLHDTFSFRFGIQDSDSPDVVRAKMERGFANGPVPSESQEQAHIIGQWLGFDFTGSPFLQGLQNDARQLRDRAFSALEDYFRHTASQLTVVIMLEDIHWADDSSLDVIEHLAVHLAKERVMILCAARPTLYERRPNWGDSLPFHVRLELQPLSRRHSRLLVEEILQKVTDLPEELRELVVENAEGNPFYIEELIKMMIEDGVFVKETGVPTPKSSVGSAPGEERWRVAQAHLNDMRVPPTLTGVLQARFDSLKPDERRILQRASVIGRVFWDQAVIALKDRQSGVPLGKYGPEEPLAGPRNPAPLDQFRRLQSREMIYSQVPSVFEDSHQYQFKHILLRDVTYESVPKRDRRIYHAYAARWLEEVTNQSQRADEYAAMIADHFDRAGELEPAAAWYRRAGEQAVSRFANHEAVRLLGRALDLTPQDHLPERFGLLMEREIVYNLQGARQAQEKDLEVLMELASRLDASSTYQGVWRAKVALRWSAMCEVTGDYPRAAEYARQSIGLASGENNLEIESQAHIRLGSVLWRQSRNDEARDSYERGLALAREANLPAIESDALRGMGILAQSGGDYLAAREYYELGLNIKRNIGDTRGIAMALNSLGVLLYELGDYSEARDVLEESIRLKRQMGDKAGENNSLNNLALIAYHTGDYASAEEYFKRCEHIAMEIGDLEGMASTLGGLGSIDLVLGRTEQVRQKREQALEIFRSLGDLQGMSGELSALAFFHNQNSQYEPGLEAAEEALRLAQEAGYPLNQVMALAEIGQAQLGLGRADSAISAYHHGLEIVQEVGVKEIALQLLAGLARASLAQMDLKRAKGYAVEIWRSLEDIRLHGETFPGQALASIDDPIQVYLTCAQVFMSEPESREQACKALEAGIHLLTTRADMLCHKNRDETLRQAYLGSLPSHRALLALSQETEEQNMGSEQSHE